MQTTLGRELILLVDVVVALGCFGELVEEIGSSL